MKINTVEHLFSTLQFSDRTAVLTTLKNEQTQNKPKHNTYWKINNTLLLDERYIKTIKDIMQFYTQSSSKFNKIQHWENLKQDIKRVSIQYACSINSVRAHIETKQRTNRLIRNGTFENTRI
jgi:hypothetical protein